MSITAINLNTFYLHLTNFILDLLRDRIEELRTRRRELVLEAPLDDQDYVDFLSFNEAIKEDMDKEQEVMDLSAKLMSIIYASPATPDCTEFGELLKERPVILRDYRDWAWSEEWNLSDDAEIVRFADESLLERGLEELKSLKRELKA